LGKGHWYWSSL